MTSRIQRRTMLGLLAAGAAAPALGACAKGGHASDPTVSTASTAQVGSGGPDMLMIIRHAEKPTGSGAPYGVTDAGEKDDKSLTIQGWSRAGALIGLFDPRDGDGHPAPPRPGLARPTRIFAADPSSGGSKRPKETVTPLAAALGTSLDLRFAKGQEAALAAALRSASGPTLVAWEHQSVAAIIAHLGPVTPKPPASWPGSRFDVVYVFNRHGDGWNFSQVPQLLLAGDSPHPIA
ncbi:hypothetical protein [Streptomyces silvisoli]|uniref:Histidine phosphatase family protein n=1 Tax=Streptomyces silvisoli TaxID=3034235 RepID=A0ABT5ZIX4_9ACTN|nr:hypothetical protein [Streptomyces silvisoli]MDF3288968.1 hypothetical protein [Streptomyces silvisoli]